MEYTLWRNFCVLIFFQDALELRIYLHDRSLMQYADKLEASGRNLSELLNTEPSVLTSEYGMKRGHVARFVDRSSACGIEMPSTLSLPARKRTLAHQGEGVRFGDDENQHDDAAAVPPPLTPPAKEKPARKQKHDDDDDDDVVTQQLYPGMRMAYNKNDNNNDGKSSSIIKSGFQEPVVLRKIAGAATASKGIYSAAPNNSAHCCGLLSPHLGSEEVTPLSVLEKIMIQKLTPEHKKGNNPFKASQPIKLPPPSKASELWANQPTLILCLRRPGYVTYLSNIFFHFPPDQLWFFSHGCFGSSMLSSSSTFCNPPSPLALKETHLLRKQQIRG
jgi:hypothetical protein